MKSQNFETGFSDCHKLVCSILRASFKKPLPKIIKYRDQKHFDRINFFMIWIVNYYKEIFTEIAMSHVKNFQKFVLIF